MGFWEILVTYLFVALGIVISVILPILRHALPKPPAGSTLAGKPLRDRIWPIAEPYLILIPFSLIVAVVVVAFSGDALADSGKALLAGFAWDSILQKATAKT